MHPTPGNLNAVQFFNPASAFLVFFTMPAKVKNTAKKQGQKRQRSKQKTISKRRKLDVEYEELGDIDSWDWNEVSTATASMTGDLGGFLCLEEIDDVAVDYEGDDQTGRVAKFKVCVCMA